MQIKGEEKVVRDIVIINLKFNLSEILKKNDRRRVVRFKYEI